MAGGARGGVRLGAGRKAGVPNKASGEVREIAKGYGPEVIEGFYSLFKTSKNETARILAGKELLDRAYGKATQMIGGDKDNPIRAKIAVEFVRAAQKVIDG